MGAFFTKPGQVGALEPEGMRRQDLTAFKELIFQDSRSFVPQARYHDADHSKDVCKNVVKLCQILGLKERESQVLEFTAAIHDLGHAGVPYKQLKDGGTRSNEEHTVRLTKAVLRALDPKNNPSLGLTNIERKEVYEMVLASSFGQTAKALWGRLNEVIGPINSHREIDQRQDLIEKNRLLKPYEPKTMKQFLLCVSDVGAYLTSPEHHILGGLKLNIENNKPLDLDKFIDEQKGFLNFYIRPLIKKFVDSIKISPEMKDDPSLLTKIGMVGEFLNSHADKLATFLEKPDLKEQITELHQSLLK